MPEDTRIDRTAARRDAGPQPRRRPSPPERDQPLLESINGIVWEADPETFRFRYVSGQAERLLGYPIEQWLSEPGCWSSHIHPDDRVRAIETCRTATAQQRSHEFEYRMQTADGRTVWLRDLVSVVVENDRPVSLRGVMVDITDSKRTEETLWNLIRGMALAVGDNFFRELTLHLADTLGVRFASVAEIPVDRPGRLLPLAVWNRDDWEDPFEYEATGTPCEHVLQSGDAVCFPNHVRELFPRDDYLVRRGVEAYLGAPLIGASGQVIGVLCVYHDQPLQEELRAKSMLRVFAARSASELERQRAERAVFQSETRYRKIFHTAPVALWELDLSGIRTTIEYWRLQGIRDLRSYLEANPEAVRETAALMRPLNVNDSALKIFEAKTRDELLRASVDDLYVPQTLGAFREWLLAIAEGKTGFETRTRARTLRGRPLDVWLKMTLPIEAKEFARVPASIMDITGQVAAARRERASDERVRRQNAALLRLTRSPELARSDLDGFGRLAARVAAETLEVERVGLWRFEDGGSVLRCNLLYERGPERCSEGLEIEASEYPRYFAALADGRVVAADDAPSDAATSEFAESYLGPLGVTSMLDAAVRRGGEVVGVVCHEHIGPGRLWHPDERDFAASVADIVSLLMESAERQQAEEAVRAAQEQLLIRQREEGRKVESELEKVKSQLVRRTRLAAIGQVAASIAHDLRNPLGAIRNAEYYLRRRIPADRPEWAEFLTIIHQEIHTADRIVTNLLEMSRAKEPAKENVDLAGAVDQAFEGVRRGDGVRLRLDLDPERYVVHADPDQLQQVLSNLFTNAIQAMEQRGELAVEARREDRTDVIVVRDSGPGVSPKVRASIFEPLFTTKAKGTGLGLAICRQIVEAHGGAIELLAAAEQGAAFAIRLPLRTDPPRTRDAAGKSRSVLIVDDERNMRKTLAQILSEEGYEVFTADTGERAVRMCGQRGFDVVLMDVRMPGIDGVEAFRRIRRSRADARVVMMSAYSLEALERAALAEGATAFLRKPLDVESVVRLIGNVERDGDTAAN